MLARLLVAWLLLGASAMAQQGSYICPQQGGAETIDIQERVLRSSVALPEKPYEEQLPIASRLPGKLVLGPLTDRMKPYEALWLLEVREPYLMVVRDGQQYDTPAEIPENLAPQRQKWARRYWSVQRFSELLKLPEMPEPSPREVMEMLDKARARAVKGCGSAAVDRILEDLVIERGFQPFASKAGFVRVRESMEDDPEFAARLAEFQVWVKGD